MRLLRLLLDLLFFDGLVFLFGFLFRFRLFLGLVGFAHVFNPKYRPPSYY